FPSSATSWSGPAGSERDGEGPPPRGPSHHLRAATWPAGCRHRRASAPVTHRQFGSVAVSTDRRSAYPDRLLGTGGGGRAGGGLLTRSYLLAEDIGVSILLPQVNKIRRGEHAQCMALTLRLINVNLHMRLLARSGRGLMLSLSRVFRSAARSRG